MEIFTSIETTVKLVFTAVISVCLVVGVPDHNSWISWPLFETKLGSQSSRMLDNINERIFNTWIQTIKDIYSIGAYIQIS